MSDQIDSLLTGIDPERQIAIRNFINAIPVTAPTPVTPELSEREMEADRRDLARTLAQVLKPQRPAPYSGEIDADACINFIDNQKEYFTVVKLGLSEWVQYTALNLTNDAKSWWRSSGLSIHTPWDTFEAEFLSFHTPPNAIAAAREALEVLKQGKRSVAVYTHEFRRLLRRVPALDKGTTLHWFIKGLETDTSKEVKLRQPTTLEFAISQATLVHSILYPNGAPVTSTTPTTPKHDSNAMDIDNLQVAIHNLSTQINNLSRFGNGSSSSTYTTALPRKLTPEDKAYLTEKGGCFRCRKIGHMANQCRAFPNQRQKPQHFNNVEVASAPAQQASPQTQSGKANSN
ncbi:MAG TPA: hypothetical protein VLN58_12940 [Verrucomicrobiae bacterium]|nr:hypothetical protein [Verrucomicrobiae bacterium]